MSQDHAGSRNGQSPTVGGSRALGVASGGLRTMRDLANFTIAHSLDVLQERTGVREANTSLRSIGETRKLIVDGQKVGYLKPVLDMEGGDNAQPTKDYEAEEQRLLAELATLRERRGD